MICVVGSILPRIFATGYSEVTSCYNKDILGKSAPFWMCFFLFRGVQ